MCDQEIAKEAGLRNILFALIAAGTVTAAVATPAEASGGCGPYRHRNYNGYCVPGGQYGYAPRPYVFGPRYGWGWRHPYYRHYRRHYYY
jgi:hypothetical protein